MSTATIDRTAPATRAERVHEPIPMSRIVGVEVSKMFNTRSGFWLLASVGITAGLATIATVLFEPHKNFGYGNFAAAVGYPMTIILPMIAILSVTSEWSQRTGLTTFTLVPHRGRVIRAKLIATLGVGVTSIALAFAVGVLGNIIGSAIVGVPERWDLSIGQSALIFLADALGMLMGFTLGILIRSSSGAIVAYFVYALVLPAALGALASVQTGFAHAQGWIDFNFSLGTLYDHLPSAKEWAQLGSAGTIWLLVPLAFGLWAVNRSEVK